MAEERPLLLSSPKNVGGKIHGAIGCSDLAGSLRKSRSYSPYCKHKGGEGKWEQYIQI